MTKVILTEGKTKKEFESFEEMFQSISEKGIVLDKVEDGKLTTVDGKEMPIEIFTTDIKDIFNKEISIYRDELRKTIVPLMKQGIVTKEQAEKLKAQFACIDK